MTRAAPVPLDDGVDGAQRRRVGRQVVDCDGRTVYVFDIHLQGDAGTVFFDV